MKVKSILLSLLIAMTIVGCSSTSGTPVSSQELANYFVKNTYEPANEFNPVIIKNQQDFEKLFGIGKTMTNTIITPDFEKSIVVGLILKTTDKQTTISFAKAEKSGDNLNVYFTVKTGAQQSFSMVPSMLEAFEKDSSVKNLQVFVNGKLEKKEVL